MVGKAVAWLADFDALVCRIICLFVGHRDLVAGSVDGELFSGERVCTRCGKRRGAFMARVLRTGVEDGELKITLSTTCKPKWSWISVGGRISTYD